MADTLINNEGGGEEQSTPESTPVDWKSSIDESYLGNETIKTYVEKGDLNGLLKDFVNKEKVVGQKTTPKSDADWSEWSSFLQEKGVVPKDPTGYGVEDEGLSSFVEAAHGAGLSKAQLDSVLNYVNTEKAKAQELESKQYEEAYGKLVEKYGGEDEAREVLSQADKYARETFEEFPEFFDFLSNTEVKLANGEVSLLGNHPLMAEALKIMFEKTADDSKKVEGSPGVSSEDIQNEFEKLTAQMGGYRGDRSDPEYREMQKRFDGIKKKLLGL